MRPECGSIPPMRRESPRQGPPPHVPNGPIGNMQSTHDAQDPRSRTWAERPTVVGSQVQGTAPPAPVPADIHSWRTFSVLYFSSCELTLGAPPWEHLSLRGCSSHGAQPTAGLPGTLSSSLWGPNCIHNDAEASSTSVAVLAFAVMLQKCWLAAQTKAASTTALNATHSWLKGAVSLKDVLGDTGKFPILRLVLGQILTLDKHLFSVLWGKWEARVKLWRRAPKNIDFFQKSNFWCNSLSWEQNWIHFPRENVRERMTNRQIGYSNLGIWQTFSQKWTNLPCHLKGTNSQCLLPIIIFALLSPNLNFRELFSTTLGLTVPYETVVTLTKVIFWYCMMRRTNVLEDLHTSGIQDFPVTSVWCDRTMRV